MAELEEKHLKSIIAAVSKGDQDLSNELMEKLGGANLPDFRDRMLSIVTDPSIPLVDEDDNVALEAAAAAESIVKAVGRPVFIIADNKVTEDFSGPSSEIWKERIVGARERIDRVIPAVGRIEVNNHPDFTWVGTGWLVDSDIIVTNRHVAVEFGRRDNARFVYRTGLNNAPMVSRIDFLEEYQRSAAAEFAVAEILWIAPTDGPDVAFLRVVRQAGQPPLAQPVPLANAIDGNDFVATIGYPARDSRVPDQALVKKLFGDVYDKKRLAPGTILATGTNELEHDCSTLGGNSGSVILSLRTGEAIALHFAGLFKEANYAVPAPRLKALLADAKRGLLDTPARIETGPIEAAARSGAPVVVSSGGGSTMRLTVSMPIEISVRIAGDGSPGAVASGAAPATAPAATIDAAVALATSELADDPDVLDVRAGYRFRSGWITDEQVVVVELREKQAPAALASSGKRAVPSAYLGIGVDVRTAALTDQLAALGIHDPFTEVRARPGQYREPPNLALERIQAPMQAVFHVSPDSGFPNLKAFLGRVRTKLTATIYEWAPNHISDALAAALDGNAKSLKMVTQQRGTSKAVAALMVSITPAIWAIHEVDTFIGQPLAGAPVQQLQAADVDRPLFEQLAAHWDEGFGRRRIPAFDRVLFRSLNMANAALAMPAVRGATIFDYGRHCALWISAFEILAHHHSGRNRADLLAVLDLLEKKPHWTRKLRARRYTVRHHGITRRTGLAGKLYAQLYQVRNDFLHGNPVDNRTLLLKEDCDRAHKQLMFRAIQQRKITGTINSTNTSSGKGWTCLDRAYLSGLTAT
ncbi:trypsin-like serine peptidase [Sphingomonas sp. CJ99]